MIKTSAAAAAILVALNFAAPAAELVSHRAFYRLTLASMSSDSEISDVQGGIGYELSDGCDGWIVEQQYALRILAANGNEWDSSDNFVSWESKDGLRYRFNVKKFRNGEQYDAVNGNAELESKGGPGMAKFDEPENDRIALPAGTLFPTEHTISIMERAREGARFDRQLVFDGSEAEGAAAVTAVILAQRPPAEDSVVKAPMGPDPVWPLKLAFYAPAGIPGQGEEMPTFELAMDIQENGIATALVLNFGDFTMNGKLESLEAIPGADC